MISYNKIKYSSWNFLVFLFFVLVFGRGSSLVVNFDPRINPIGSLLYVGCLFYMLANYRKECIAVKSILAKIFWGILIVWTVFHVFFLDGGFPVIIYGQFLLHIFAGILIIKTYGENIGVYFEKVMVLLSAISIVCWSIETVGGQEVLLKFPILLENTYGNSDYSILFYTLGNSNIGGHIYEGLCRNSGCAWEPGLFSVMLCISLFFNLSRNRGIKCDRNLLILLVALITTFSTTGYVVAMLLFACYYIFSKKMSFVRKLLYVSVFIWVSIYIYKLPFMSDKIATSSDKENFTIESGVLEWHERTDQTYTVDRFEGLYLDWLNLKHYPVLGYGLQREKSYVYKTISPYVKTSNGLVKPLAQFGLLLGLLFLLLTYKSCRKLSYDYSFEVPWILFMVIVVGSISYMFDSTPIMRAIELYALYNMKTIVCTCK